jgi:hypothetical protein
MSETLQIEREKVIAAYENGTDADKTTLTKLFPDLLNADLLKRITSFEAVCKEVGYDSKAYEPMAGMTEDELHDLYSRKIKLVYKVFNAGWIPDFSDKNQAKYYPWFEFKKGSGFVLYDVYHNYGGTAVGARLCSHSEQIVLHICKHFLKEYNDYLLS